MLALPLIGGAVLQLPAGINGQLAKQVSAMLAVAFLSFAGGGMVLLMVWAPRGYLIRRAQEADPVVLGRRPVRHLLHRHPSPVHEAVRRCSECW